jgi:hypothetical protein
MASSKYKALEAYREDVKAGHNLFTPEERRKLIEVGLLLFIDSALSIVYCTCSKAYEFIHPIQFTDAALI